MGICLEWDNKQNTIYNDTNETPGSYVNCFVEQEQIKEYCNLAIVGDNRKVLPILLNNNKTYDLIYLDPPYNGYKIVDGKPKPEIDDVEWLNNFFCIARYSRELLKPDGLLLISINDRQAARCRIICDEIYGEYNFMTQIVRKRIDIKEYDSHIFNRQHEYLLVFAKDAEIVHKQWKSSSISTWWENMGYDSDAEAEQIEMFGNVIINYAKPVKFLKHCISLCQKNDASILDPYSGSGTMAHALIEMNNEDGGKRTFTLIQRRELVDDMDVANICLERINIANNKYNNIGCYKVIEFE